MDKQDAPLVSVICLCYNHSEYVIESLDSVITQSYPNVELIIVNDASTDSSDEQILEFLESHPDINYLSLQKNHGNCKAFNLGWQASSGKYIIDLAADDILLEDSISIAVAKLTAMGSAYGVHFGDAQIIDSNGVKLREHITTELFNRDVPQGYIFTELLAKYFINPATMMYTKALLLALGGYDESLAYEDFDLWIRSSKKFKYCYSNQFTIAKRELGKSYGSSQYRPWSKILRSTYKVCKKAFLLCENDKEYDALLTRINYEMKMAFFSVNWRLVVDFYRLKKEVKSKLSVQES
jgi:glycosyltransferase involved in cell wall biosynthesis